MTRRKIDIDIGTWFWLLRHPSCRRCPQCKLTCGQRSTMATQDGVCHDCYDPIKRA